MKKVFIWAGYLVTWILFWWVLSTVGDFSIISTWQGWAVIGLGALLTILQPANYK